MASLIGARPAKKAGRLVVRRVDGAIAEVEKPGPLEPRVHQARRALKKARATLKLLRPRISKKLYKTTNALCRDAGLILSATRDAQALQAAWKGLRLRAPDVERALAEEARRAAEGLDAKKSRQILLVARAQAKRIVPARPGWKGVADGLRLGYEAGRKAWRKAKATGSDEDFHEWRKRVKDQRYQVDLFLNGSASLRHLDEALDRLSDLLGDDHDLVVLRDKIGVAYDEALRAIGRKEAELRQKALVLAERVYSETSGAFARRVKRAWKKAR